ncbi:MAG: arginine--tRNA ligase [bacterium]|nr:arginine--tRNA ligase [bacterium]
MYWYLEQLNKISSALQEILGESVELEKPPKKEYGDLATPVAFKLAKKLKKNPAEIAKQLEEQLKNKLEGIEVRAIGGFLNFCLPEKDWVDKTVQEILFFKTDYGKQDIGQGKKVLVDHTSANPNKPLHLGHLRNACIGDSVCRLFSFMGYRTEAVYYVNDLGRQVAEAAYGWLELEQGALPADKPFDWYIGEVYVKAHQAGIPEEKITEYLQLLERQDSELARKVKEMCRRCLDCHLDLLERIGILFDVLVWESDIVRCGLFERATAWLLEKGYLQRVTEQDQLVKEGKSVPGKEYLGCYILRLSRFGMDDFVYLRSSGAPTYTAKDIAFALWKFGKIKGLKFKFYKKYKNGKDLYTSSEEGEEMDFGNADIVINVIGKEQTYAQQIVKYALKLIGFEKEAENYVHLAYGLVERKGIKLSGRKGTWKGFTIYEVLESLKEKIKEKTGDEKTAEKVAISVLRYEMLRYELKENIVLDEQRLLNPKERGGIYIIYTYVRILHILNKLGEFSPLTEVYKYIKEEETKEVVKLLAEFPRVLLLALRNIDPKLLADYTFELCQLLNSLYEKYPVVHEQAEQKRLARATVLLCAKYVLERLFDLLGMQPVEKM